MSNTKRTILILDHSPQARGSACYDTTATQGGAAGEDSDEFDLEPCSLWSSFVHATLHYARLAWDLSPVGYNTQISVHVAPGVTSALDSTVLNGWAAQEQSLRNITTQLRELQQQDDTADAASSGTTQDESRTSQLQHAGWIVPALKGAIAHALEPAFQQQQQHLGSMTVAGPASQPQQSRIMANIVMVLIDPEEKTKDEEQEVEEGEDTDMSDESDQGWMYGYLDLRRALTEALQSLQDCVRNSKVTNVNVDFIRISAQKSRTRADIVKEEISRVCTASVYTVLSEDETSTTKALTNHFLLNNKDVQLLRLHNLPLKNHGDQAGSIDLFYRTDHIRALARRESKTQDIEEKDEEEDEKATENILQNTPRSVQEVTELDYGVECAKISHVLPTQCAHLATISPSTFVSSFFPFVHGKMHLLKAQGSKDVASKAMFDHGGQLFVHCLQRVSDSRAFESSSEAALQSATKRRLDSQGNSSLEEFVEAIIRPNTIIPGTDSFMQEGNMFTEIVPPGLKPTTAPGLTAADDFKDPSAEEGMSSLGVNMALVHTTSKLDLETRWLVQWEGERIHPILPPHSMQIQRFKAAICKNNVDSAGFSTIQSVLDALIADARPSVLPGESGPPMGPEAMMQQQQRFRESAQAILADLWMIGQRFKSVSSSHVEAARLIATKITPKGLDHQTVRLTLMPPNRRPGFFNADHQGTGSPIVDSGDINSDGWNRNRNQRGGGNAGNGMGRGGRGGGNGRFDNINRGGRGGAGGNSGPGGGGRGGGRGGFRGGHNNNLTHSPGGGNNGGNADDMNFGGFDPSAGPNGDIMLSMTGKTQPVPYLVTEPPTREEVEEAEGEYLAQLGEDGCLLKAYWGSRGAQGSAIASVLNSVTSLDSPSTIPGGSSNGAGGPGGTPVLDPVTAATLLAQQKMKKLSAKRPRLQDFAGRTPVSENGGYSK